MSDDPDERVAKMTARIEEQSRLMEAIGDVMEETGQRLVPAVIDAAVRRVYGDPDALSSEQRQLVADVTERLKRSRYN